MMSSPSNCQSGYWKPVFLADSSGVFSCRSSISDVCLLQEDRFVELNKLNTFLWILGGPLDMSLARTQ